LLSVSDYNPIAALFALPFLVINDTVGGVGGEVSIETEAVEPYLASVYDRWENN
jgi:hypothetical protein